MTISENSYRALVVAMRDHYEPFKRKMEEALNAPSRFLTMRPRGRARYELEADRTEPLTKSPPEWAE